MRKGLSKLSTLIIRLWHTKWRYLLIALGFVPFAIVWTLPLIFLPEKYSMYGEWWAFGYILVPFYALSMWHVLSEDKRELPLFTKFRQSLLIAFNKLLFALIFFILYVMTWGFINGEI
jgi:hypothetical protein